MTVDHHGDPASLSSLGAALARAGDTLAARRDLLHRMPEEIGWTGLAADSFTAAWQDTVGGLDATADLTVAAAHLLQEYATQLHETRAGLQQVQRFCEDNGLSYDPVSGVQLGWGVYSTEVAEDRQDQLVTASQMLAEVEDQARTASVRLVAQVADLGHDIARVTASLASR